MREQLTSSEQERRLFKIVLWGLNDDHVMLRSRGG
jgi:hypothetical protein